MAFWTHILKGSNILEFDIYVSMFQTAGTSNFQECFSLASDKNIEEKLKLFEANRQTKCLSAFILV